MDMHRPADVWLGIAIAQALLITTAFNVAPRAPHGAARRPPPEPARSDDAAVPLDAGGEHLVGRAASTSSRVEKISTSL